jgi:hypothetical protein
LFALFAAGLADVDVDALAAALVVEELDALFAAAEELAELAELAAAALLVDEICGTEMFAVRDVAIDANRDAEETVRAPVGCIERMGGGGAVRRPIGFFFVIERVSDNSADTHQGEVVFVIFQNFAPRNRWMSSLLVGLYCS